MVIDEVIKLNIKELITVCKKKKIPYISKMKEMNLQYKKCEKIANNRASIELKNDTDRIKRFCSNFIDCGYKKMNKQ